jgi:hypothetical protein
VKSAGFAIEEIGVDEDKKSVEVNGDIRNYCNRRRKRKGK